MSYFIVLIFMLMLGVDLSYLFKRGFGQTAALANFILISVLYLGGMFADMRSAMYFYLAAVIILTACVGFCVARKRDAAQLKKVFKNPALLLYTAIGIVFGIIFVNYSAVVNAIGDEMTHWALVAKNMFVYDNFGNIGNATTMFDRYVPATGIFLYAFQIFETGFRSGAIYSAMDLLIISLVLPVFELFDKKTSLPCILCFVAVILECFLFNIQLFRSVLVDVPIAMLAGYIFLAYLTDKDRADGFTVVNVALACLVLTLTKSSGLPLVIFALIFVAIHMFTIGKEQTKRFFEDRRNFVFVLLPFVLIAFAKLSWSWYVDYYNVGAGWNSSEMTLSNILQWLRSPDEYQSAVTSKFLKTFFLGNGYGVQIPELLGLLLTAGACALLWFKTKDKAFCISTGIMTVIIAVGYAVYLMLLYIFSFAYAEGANLASYCRYMSSMWLTLALIYIYLMTDFFAIPLSEKNLLPKPISAKLKPHAYPIFAAAVGVFVLTASLGGYFTCESRMKNADRQYDIWVHTLENLSSDDSVYIIIDDNGGAGMHAMQYLVMRFMATPMQTSGYIEGGNYSEGRDVEVWWTGNPFSSKLSLDELSSEISNYTHVYMHDVWNEFEEKYGALFESPIEDDTLYEITYSDGQLKLVKV